jgi:hypothetical protein
MIVSGSPPVKTADTAETCSPTTFAKGNLCGDDSFADVRRQREAVGEGGRLGCDDWPFLHHLELDVRSIRPHNAQSSPATEPSYAFRESRRDAAGPGGYSPGA